jgi:predicted MFS family arabinose efflux permease
VSAAPTPGTRAAQNRALLGGVCCLLIAMGIGRFAYTPLLPAMQRATGFGNQMAGFIASSNFLGYFLGALATTFIPPHTDKRRLLRIALVASVLSTGAMAWSDASTAWLLLRFVAGFASACVFVLAGTLVMQTLQATGSESRMGIHFSGVGTGIALSGLLLAQLGEQLGWRGGWTALALFCSALLPLCWRIPAATAARTAPAPDAATKASGATARVSLPLIVFPMGLLTAAYLFEGLGYIVSGTFLVAIIKHTPGLAAFGEYAWVAVGLAAAPSAVFWSAVMKKTGPLKALIAAHLVQALGIVLPVLSGSLAAALLAAVLFGGTFVGITLLAFNLAARIAPAQSGRLIATLTTAYGLGQILGPIAAGFLAGEGGSFDHSLLAAGAVVALGALLLAAGALRKPRTHA